jgi:hypothetical protein
LVVYGCWRQSHLNWSNRSKQISEPSKRPRQPLIEFPASNNLHPLAKHGIKKMTPKNHRSLGILRASSSAPYPVQVFIDHPVIEVIRPLLMHPEIWVDCIVWVKSLAPVFTNTMSILPEVIVLLSKPLKRCQLDECVQLLGTNLGSISVPVRAHLQRIDPVSATQSSCHFPPFCGREPGIDSPIGVYAIPIMWSAPFRVPSRMRIISFGATRDIWAVFFQVMAASVVV